MSDIACAIAAAQRGAPSLLASSVENLNILARPDNLCLAVVIRVCHFLCSRCCCCCCRWWEKEQLQPTADDFHAHALREMQQWRDCVAAADLATCVRRYNPQQLVKGMYSQFLQVSSCSFKLQKFCRCCSCCSM